MKQTHRLALRVAERRQRRSAVVTGQRHVDEFVLTPIERIKIRRQCAITPEFKRDLEEAGIGAAIQEEAKRVGDALDQEVRRALDRCKEQVNKPDYYIMSRVPSFWWKGLPGNGGTTT